MSSKYVIHLPAFAYRFLLRTKAAKGVGAWALLHERRLATFDTKEVAGWLAKELGLHITNVRLLLLKGEGTFWHRLEHHRYRLATWGELWQEVREESIVDRDETLTVPRQVLSASLSEFRAWMAQAGLSRGARVPTSKAMSAAEIGTALGTIRRYRKILRDRGRLKTEPQYKRVRQSGTGPMGNGEFVKGVWVYRRIADVVLLLRPDSSIMDAFRLNEVVYKAQRQRPRHYFPDHEAVETWLGKDKEVASKIVVNLGDGEWEEKCFRSGIRSISYTEEESESEKLERSSRREDFIPSQKRFSHEMGVTSDSSGRIVGGGEEIQW